MRNEALYRQWKILHMIYSYSNRGVSKSELAREFSVTRKTISRDITNLSASGFPIYEELDEARGNQLFYYMDGDYKIPQIRFSADEFASLLLMLKLSYPLESYFNGLFQDTFSKIMAQTPVEYREFALKLSAIVLPETMNLIPYTPENSNNISLIMENIINCRKISFKYDSIYSQKEKSHTVSPLALKFFNNNFYLAAHSAKYGQVLIFAVNRISDLKPTDKIQDHVKFNPEEFFNAGFGINAGDKFTVKLKFSKQIAQYISERRWHENQKIALCKDGSIILTLQAKSLPEMTKFVLSFRDNVKVLEPEILITEVKQTIKKVAELYEDSNVT
ncbi:MAG: WYL domain-containing protein [Candidatus Cloacimonetes bacterium]|nr:WYL domain-containing protein [Candidatus Cloacimonadota bacterium]